MSSLDADLATLRERGLCPACEMCKPPVVGSADCDGCIASLAALDRLEAEIARLRGEMIARDRYDALSALYIDMTEKRDSAERELARLREEREGYKRDFLAASERCGIAEKERDRLQLILADINPDGDALRLAVSDYEECATERDIARERAEAAEREVVTLREEIARLRQGE